MTLISLGIFWLALTVFSWTVKSQPVQLQVGYFQHKGDSTVTYLRFTELPLPEDGSINVVQTWVIDNRTGNCSYVANTVDWDGNTMFMKNSRIPWETEYNLRTDMLTIHFSNGATVVYERAPPSHNPASSCINKRGV